MKVTIVTKRPCIRVAKEAFALKGLGHQINLVSPVMDSEYPYTHVLYWGHPKELSDAVKLIDKETDVFVVHNEPTWPAMIVREALPDAKIVLDYHDSIYWYFDKEAEVVAPNEQARWFEEDYCVDVCNGFVVGSEDSRNELSGRTDKPIAVVPPASLRTDYRYQAHNFQGGLVSQGGHAIPGHFTRVGEHWRDYTPLYKYLRGRCNVFAYLPTGEAVREYYKPLVSNIDSQPYDVLLNKLGEHSWNLVGNWVDHIVWQYSAPNKFYDALAAGLPSVVFHIKSVKEIIEEEKFGLIVEHPDELLERWDEARAMRTLVMLKREKYCMERFIGRAIDLYEQVIRA